MLEQHRLFEALLSNKPKLHYWGGEWNCGGLDNIKLRRLFELACQSVESATGTIIETGAGLSTLAFLAAKPRRLISIVPDRDLKKRIDAEAVKLSLSQDGHEFYIERSEYALPELARTSEPCIDVALIDGGHGMTTAFVDLCYINCLLKKGGYLALDDIHLHSVRQIYLLLQEQPSFELVNELGKLAIFRKNTSDRFLPDHMGQPFVARNSLSIDDLFKQSNATIAAIPNPVPAGLELGATIIIWNTGNGSKGDVHVSVDGGDEKLFFRGSKGSKPAAWIAAGSTYEFRLYEGLNRAKLLASVQVTRNK